MFLHFILALIPIIWLIVALSVIKMPGYRACLIALAVAFVEGCVFWHLNPVHAGTAILEGVTTALWPICLVIIAALFMYNLTLETKAMDTIKGMLLSVSEDSRILMLLIAWGFGNFMEGMAGFGTAVAIPAGMLVGVGFEPVLAVVACLVINSTPTVFGSVGVPEVTLANLTGLDVVALSHNSVVIQLLLTVLSPFLAVAIIGGGIKALKGMIPFILITAASFIVPQFIAASALGAELPNIIGSVVSLLCMVAAAKLLPHAVPDEYKVAKKEGGDAKPLTANTALVACAPFIFTFIILLVTSKMVPFINGPLSTIKSSFKIYAGENPNTVSFSWVNTPGILIFIAGFLGGLIQGAGPARQLAVLKKVFLANIKTIITICSVVSVAKVMGYSGMIADIATVLALTGSLFPLFSPLIGVIGGFVTGSGTNTAVLFGNVQKLTAESIGASPLWLGAANMMGAGIGKMISPQGIAIGCAAVGLVGGESKILSKAIPFCLLYTIIGGLLCFFLPMLGVAG